MGKQETLETIWEVPDELWERIEPIILEEDPPKARGRKRSDPRQMLNGIIFRLRSAVADGFADAGWYVTRIQEPPGMHMMLSQLQVPLVEEFLTDLSLVVEGVKAGQIVARGTTVTY